MEISKRFSFQSRKPKKKGLLTVSTLKNITISDVVHFAGNKVPLKKSFNMITTTMFVPESPNYPGIDFFIWDPSEQVLMAFQVTVKKPFTSHSKIDGANGNLGLWHELFQSQIDVYWIIPENCVGNPKDFGDNVILIEDLQNDFHAFNKLTLVYNNT